jgi:hypothetical protein
MLPHVRITAIVDVWVNLATIPFDLIDPKAAPTRLTTGAIDYPASADAHSELFRRGYGFPETPEPIQIFV